MAKIGIVGHGADKFSAATKDKAKDLIRKILTSDPTSILVSGHSPVGGVDIWSEEVATEIGIYMDLKIPRQKTWDAEYGYKQRNLDIARDSDEVHVILVEKYPEGYNGMQFDKCYHCNTSSHVKSGACWTGNKAQQMGKKVYWHIIKLEGAI